MNRIKIALYGNAYESNTGVMDVEAYHDMDVRDMDREEMENEITEDIAIATEASDTVVEIQEAVDVLAANVEEMNPVEVGKAIGAIEDKLETVAENVEEAVVDTEALASGNLASGVRRELEAISDKLKSAWLKIKQFFRAVWEKIKQMGRSLILWLTDGTKKAKALLEKIDKKGELKSDLDYKQIADKLGTKLAIVFDADLKPAVLVKALSGVDVGDPASSDSSPGVEKLVRNSTDYKVSINLTSKHNVAVTRITNGVIKFMTYTTDQTYAGYHSATMTPSASARIRESIAKDIVSGTFNLNSIQEFLKIVPDLTDTAKKQNDGATKYLSELDKLLSTNIEDVKFKQGMFKTIWSNTLGHKSADQYTAEEKVKVIKNMMSASTSSISDTIFGLTGLVKEINAVATIVLGCYKDKSE